jgi:hypothetical protein
MMKNSYFSSAAAVLVLAGSALVPATMAVAASDNAAQITQGVGCTGFVPTADGEVDLDALINTEEGHHRVITSSGNKIVSCQFDIPEELVPSSTRSASGFECSVNGETTTDSRMLATPSGRAVMICKKVGR